MSTYKLIYFIAAQQCKYCWWYSAVQRRKINTDIDKPIIIQ